MFEDAHSTVANGTGRPAPQLPSPREPQQNAGAHARFLDGPAGPIYCITYEAGARRRATLVVCGPFGLERERAYMSLVAWARVLAARGFDATRFDYHGMGASGGNFEQMTCSAWREDARRCIASVAESARGAPLVLHGVRLGALVAAELFAEGLGDGLLLWAPPRSAEALLRDTLRHDPRRIAALEAGVRVEVDGYGWSRELWRDARRHPLVVPSAAEARPWHALHLRGAGFELPGMASCSETVDSEAFWGSSSAALVPRCAALFRASLRWLEEHGPSHARAA